MNGKKGSPQKTRQTREETEAKMALGRRNYVWILIGLGAIIVGFLLMSGGGSDDPAVFNEKMFSFRRVTLAPIVVMAGFAIEVYAIMSRKGNNEQTKG